jgi:hypothetical protein
MTRRWLPVWLLLAASCAASASFPRAGPSPVPLVREAIPAGEAETVFDRALRALDRRGYELVTCDVGRGALRTERVEFNADCNASSCLTRQLVTVKLGWRSVRVAVVREVFDGGTRSWVRATDPASLAEVSRQEDALLRELMAADLEGARLPGPDEAGVSCRRASSCGPGQCSVMLDQVGK